MYMAPPSLPPLGEAAASPLWRGGEQPSLKPGTRPPRGFPPCAHGIHTGLFVEALLELSPLKLDGVLLQLGLEALDGVVHHVHFHLSQDLKDPPVAGREQPHADN